MNYDNEIKDVLNHDATPSHDDGFFETLNGVLDPEATPVGRPAKSVLRRHWLSFASTAAVAAVAVALLATTSLTSTPVKKSTELALPPTPTSLTDPSTATSPTVTSPTVSVSSTSTTAPQLPASPQLTLAAQIGQRAAAQYGNAKSISGTLTRTKAGEATVTRDFKARDDGTYWYQVKSDDVLQSTTAYDAATGDYSFANGSGYGVMPHTETEGGMDYYGGFSLYNLLNGLTLDTNADVQETKLDGKKVWALDAKLAKPIIGLGDVAPIGLSEIKAYFDQTSLFPVRIEAGGYTSTLSNLEINPKLTNDDFAVEHAEGATPVKDDYDPGYVRMSLADASAAAKSTIALPKSVPDGFTAGPYMYSQRYGRFEVVYHKGLLSLTYTLQFKNNGHPDTIGLDDPWYNLNETNATHESFKPTAGKYKNVPGTVVSSPATRPHAGLTGATTSAYIGGDMSTDDIKVALNSIS